MATSAQISNVTSQINALITDQHNEEVTGTALNTVLHLIKALAPTAFTGSFDNGDLDASFEIIVTHSLNTSLPSVRVFDGAGREYSAANVEITIVNANSIKLGLGDEISGTFTYIIIKHD